MRNKAEDIAPPTYSFDQLIEMIRTATEVELSAIRGLLTRDDEMELYCMFHVELLTFAIHTRTKDLSC
jgi:hypothetical protein